MRGRIRREQCLKRGSGKTRGKWDGFCSSHTCQTQNDRRTGDTQKYRSVEILKKWRGEGDDEVSRKYKKILHAYTETRRGVEHYENLS